VFSFTSRDELITLNAPTALGSTRSRRLESVISGWPRHTWASPHRQAGTSCDELKDRAAGNPRVMVDRYAKFATGHLAAAAPRIERGRHRNVINSSRSGKAKGRALTQLFVLLVGRAGLEPATNGLKVRCSTN
jgi:hypothetical protein